MGGLAGQPSIARPTGKGLYLCVNGRPIKDRNLTHAVKEAYRGLMPMDKFPVAVVLLEIDPHAVDVNVHPTKAEVRFRNPSHVHGLILSAVRQRLLGGDLTPSASLQGNRFHPSALTPQDIWPAHSGIDRCVRRLLQADGPEAEGVCVPGGAQGASGRRPGSG